MSSSKFFILFQIFLYSKFLLANVSLNDGFTATTPFESSNLDNSAEINTPPTYVSKLCTAIECVQNAWKSTESHRKSFYETSKYAASYAAKHSKLAAKLFVNHHGDRIPFHDLKIDPIYVSIDDFDDEMKKVDIDITYTTFCSNCVFKGWSECERQDYKNYVLLKESGTFRVGVNQRLRLEFPYVPKPLKFKPNIIADKKYDCRIGIAFMSLKTSAVFVEASQQVQLSGTGFELTEDKAVIEDEMNQQKRERMRVPESKKIILMKENDYLLPTAINELHSPEISPVSSPSSSFSRNSQNLQISPRNPNRSNAGLFNDHFSDSNQPLMSQSMILTTNFDPNLRPLIKRFKPVQITAQSSVEQHKRSRSRSPSTRSPSPSPSRSRSSSTEIVQSGKQLQEMKTDSQLHFSDNSFTSSGQNLPLRVSSIPSRSSSPTRPQFEKTASASRKSLPSSDRAHSLKKGANVNSLINDYEEPFKHFSDGYYGEAEINAMRMLGKGAAKASSVFKAQFWYNSINLKPPKMSIEDTHYLIEFEYFLSCSTCAIVLFERNIPKPKSAKPSLEQTRSEFLDKIDDSKLEEKRRILAIWRKPNLKSNHSSKLKVTVPSPLDIENYLIELVIMVVRDGGKMQFLETLEFHLRQLHEKYEKSSLSSSSKISSPLSSKIQKSPSVQTFSSTINEVHSSPSAMRYTSSQSFLSKAVYAFSSQPLQTVDDREEYHFITQEELNPTSYQLRNSQLISAQHSPLFSPQSSTYSLPFQKQNQNKSPKDLLGMFYKLPKLSGSDSELSTSQIRNRIFEDGLVQQINEQSSQNSILLNQQTQASSPSQQPNVRKNVIPSDQHPKSRHSSPSRAASKSLTSSLETIIIPSAKSSVIQTSESRSSTSKSNNAGKFTRESTLRPSSSSQALVIGDTQPSFTQRLSSDRIVRRPLTFSNDFLSTPVLSKQLQYTDRTSQYTDRTTNRKPQRINQMGKYQVTKLHDE